MRFYRIANKWRTTKLYLAGSESQAPHVRAAVDAAFSFCWSSIQIGKA
jgi:hypothetical protein